jgi:integrase/recombinase XerD
LPYYFTEEEVILIFGVCHNLKHLAMLQTLFYGCLRASELCNLDDEDLDLKKATIRIREGKGGRDGIAHLSPSCINTLVKYLQVRPHLEIDGRTPLFFTDFAKDGIDMMCIGCSSSTKNWQRLLGGAAFMPSLAILRQQLW